MLQRVRPGDIRFAYRKNPIVGNGYSHYYWGIDDIRIEANPVANDLELVQLTNGDVYFLFEYRVTPMEQAIPKPMAACWPAFSTATSATPTRRTA